MELPASEENHEEVVRVPESLKVSPTVFFKREKGHNDEAGGHNPTSDARSSGEVSA